MTNFKSVLTYGLVLIGVVFILMLTLSDVLFGDLTNTESIKSLWIIIPAILALGGFLYYKTK